MSALQSALDAVHYLVGTLTQPEIVEKAWGHEIIVCREPHACKVMVVQPGCNVSLHLHKEKHESFLLISGILNLITITPQGKQYNIALDTPFSSITLPAMTPHTFSVPSDGEPAVFIEASTKDSPDDSYRIYPSKGPGPDITDR